MNSEEDQLSPIERALAARKTTPAPTGRCSTRDLAEYYGVGMNMISRAAYDGLIASAHKVLDRWVFDFKIATESWTPSAVVRVEKGLPPVGGRRSDGPFAKGNTAALGGRGGRPKGKVQLRFLSAMTAEVSEKDWIGIIQKAVSQALQGDHRARLWLSHYLMGKPIERVLAKVDVGGERFSIAERAVAVEELLGFLTGQGEGEKVIDGTSRETVSAEPDTTPG